LGDYQGVYEVEDDALTPSQIFTNLLDELRRTIPADLAPMPTTTSRSSTTSTERDALSRTARK